MQLRTDNGYGTVNIETGTNRVRGTSVLADWTQVNAGFSWFSLVGSTAIPFLIQTKTTPSLSSSGFWEVFLDATYIGPTITNGEYVIHKDFTLNLNLPLFAPGDLQRSQITNRAFQILDFYLFDGSPGVAGQLFSQPLTNGQTTPVSFVFTVPRLADTYVPTIVIENIVDSSPLKLDVLITAKSLTGFTASLVGTPDSGNYIMRAKA